MSISERMASMAKGGGFGGENKGGMKAEPAGEGGEHSELHPHGDGSYHTITGGQKTEHPDITHAMAHMAGHHEPDGKHSHVMHHEDGSHTSSHHADGETSGPHDHENLEVLKDHFDQFMNEEGQEGRESGGESHDGLM